ncbi:MAG: class I SAM-dependent methyltransferase [Granulosicoccus sp.]|nr:class I SAM-dependent methyltransferase [Granulosicoccus sp.]
MNNIVRNFKRDQLGSYPISKLFIPYKYRRRWAYRKMLLGSSAKEKFSEIYEKNFWGSTESISGGGSEFDFTERLREWLVSAIPKYNVRTFVDAPCGDFNWMQHVLPDVDVEYFGFDIVDSVIVENARKHSTDSVHFAVADICTDELPPCDLLMVRDCLFHLSFEDIDRFLKNLSGIDYRYLLTSTHIVDPNFRNSNIATGHFRKIDLFKDPFHFREDSVLERIDDYPSGSKSPREMLLLEKVNVPTSLVFPV